MAQKATFIVAVVVVRDNKILLIQEAKESCKGLWYLPGKYIISYSYLGNYSNFWATSLI